LLGYGDFNYQAVATKISDGTVKLISAGIKPIQPLLTASGDTRTFWQIQYENAKEIYDFLNNNPALEVNFKGKLLKYVDRSIALEAMLIAKQNMEAEFLAQQGKVSRPKIYKAVFS